MAKKSKTSPLDAQYAQICLDAVLSVTEALHTIDNLDELFARIVAQLQRVVTFEAGYIALYHEGERTLSFDYQIDEGEVTGNNEHTPVERYVILSHVIEQREPVCFDDLHVDVKAQFPTYKSNPFGNTQKVSRSWFAVPLLTAWSVQGVLCIQSYTPAMYGPQEQRLVTILAGQIASAVANVRLYSTAKQEASRNLAILKSIADGVVVCDESGQIMIANSRASELLLQAPDDITGLRFADVPMTPLIRLAAAATATTATTGSTSRLSAYRGRRWCRSAARRWAR